MKIRNIILIILLMPLSIFAQTLGPNQGDHLEISSVGGATTNIVMNKLWLYRPFAGNNWYNSRLHDGISVDASFLIPHFNTKTWWERDPFSDIQSWGNAASTYLTINQGNVGIGTVSPLNALHVYTNSDLYGIITGDGANSNLRISGTASGATGYGIIQTFIGGSTEGGILSLQRGGGNVGIGTGIPTEKLSVNGKIRAHEIKVETANWPDYVFAKDYQLPSLKETEQFIKDKGHLPGIPSAEEVKTNGIDLGEMNAKLLKKIEELTLQLIEKDKEFFKEREINKSQDERLEKLESMILKLK